MIRATMAMQEPFARGSPPRHRALPNYHNSISPADAPRLLLFVFNFHLFKSIDLHVRGLPHVSSRDRSSCAIERTRPAWAQHCGRRAASFVHCLRPAPGVALWHIYFNPVFKPIVPRKLDIDEFTKRDTIDALRTIDSRRLSFFTSISKGE